MEYTVILETFEEATESLVVFLRGLNVAHVTAK